MIESLLQTTRELRGSSHATEDRALLDEGAAGERIVARVRLVMTAAITLAPVANLLRSRDAATLVGVGATVVSVIVACVLVALTRHGFYRRWLGFATSIYDITMVSLVLAAFLAIGKPLLATNSLVVYPIYLLAIAGSALRYDPRVSVATGVCGMLQYLGVLWVAAAMGGTNPSAAGAGTPYGEFGWGDQIGRLVLMAAMTLLAATIAARSVRLRRLSVYDALTGLHTRGYFEERLAEELRRASRYRRDVSIALIDIDRYKDFNDRYGHPAGDEALRVVAGALRRALRATDIVARYGGEEFVMILPETRAPDALAKIDAVRREIEALPIDVARGQEPARLTISAGVASWPSDGTWPDELVSAADDQLLAAKRAGRNRVFGARPDTPPAAAYAKAIWSRAEAR